MTHDRSAALFRIQSIYPTSPWSWTLILDFLVVRKKDSVIVSIFENTHFGT